MVPVCGPRVRDPLPPARVRRVPEGNQHLRLPVRLLRGPRVPPPRGRASHPPAGRHALPVLRLRARRPALPVQDPRDVGQFLGDRRRVVPDAVPLREREVPETLGRISLRRQHPGRGRHAEGTSRGRGQRDDADHQRHEPHAQRTDQPRVEVLEGGSAVTRRRQHHR